MRGELPTVRGRQTEFRLRYKVWRSNKDKSLHLLCGNGEQAFDALPNMVRHMGPWTGGAEGEFDRLRLPYRLMLGEQGFVIIYQHVSKLELEAAPAGASGPLADNNAECPQCKGAGRVPMYHGLRDKECPRCRGRGWVRAKP
jgi:hypothetical protein